jgi:hypothetical protein
MGIGSITVESLITREEARFDFGVLHLGETELTGGVRPLPLNSTFTDVRRELAEAMQTGGIPTIIRLLDTHFGEMPVSIRSLFRDEQRRILHELIVATLEEAESAFRQLHERYDPLLRFHTRLGIPVPKVLQPAAEFDLNLQIRRLLEQETPTLLEVMSLLREAREQGVATDETTRLAFKLAIERAAERFRERPDDHDRLEVLDTLVSIIREAQLYVDLRRAQNIYYRMRASVRPVIATAAGGGRWLEVFDSLGERLNLAPAV